jgi:hypothetical protein
MAVTDDKSIDRRHFLRCMAWVGTGAALSPRPRSCKIVEGLLPGIQSGLSVTGRVR